VVWFLSSLVAEQTIVRKVSSLKPLTISNEYACVCQAVNSDKLSKFINAINGNEGSGYELSISLLLYHIKTLADLMTRFALSINTRQLIAFVTAKVT